MREMKISGLSQRNCWDIKVAVDKMATLDLSVTYRKYGRRCDLVFSSYKPYRNQLEFLERVVRILNQVLHDGEADGNGQAFESKFTVDIDDVSLEI